MMEEVEYLLESGAAEKAAENPELVPIYLYLGALGAEILGYWEGVRRASNEIEEMGSVEEMIERKNDLEKTLQSDSIYQTFWNHVSNPITMGMHWEYQNRIDLMEAEGNPYDIDQTSGKNS